MPLTSTRSVVENQRRRISFARTFDLALLEKSREAGQGASRPLRDLASTARAQLAIQRLVLRC
jgi:hypothetical protein